MSAIEDIAYTTAKIQYDKMIEEGKNLDHIDFAVLITCMVVDVLKEHKTKLDENCFSDHKKKLI